MIQVPVLALSVAAVLFGFLAGYLARGEKERRDEEHVQGLMDGWQRLFNQCHDEFKVMRDEKTRLLNARDCQELADWRAHGVKRDPKSGRILPKETKT